MVSNAVGGSAQSDAYPSLLSDIDEAERGRLRALFETVRPGAGTTLARAGEPFEYLYFPNGAIVSMIVRLRDGETVEAGLVGDEGLLGMNLFWGGDRALMTAIVQVAGEIERVRVDAIRERLDEFPSLARAACCYGSTLLVTVAQVAACNATHNLRQRMARWLLMAHDRAGRDRFRLTHEFIATMINVRRAGVSQFASELRGAGAIAYTRGEVQIVDRAKLEAEACECYDVIRRQTLGPHADHRTITR
jgi:CRP-like cAMP-binding protein